MGIFLDSETNGLNPLKHKILEIAFKIVDLGSGEVREEFQSLIAQPRTEWEKSDPESLKVNGFTWEEVCKGGEPLLVAEQIKSCLNRHEVKRKSAVFICQNPSFDRAFFGQLINPDVQESLLWPYHWLDLASMYWARSIAKNEKGKLPWETGLSKDKIAAANGLPTEEKPHRAMQGVCHLLLCYKMVVGFPQ